MVEHPRRYYEFTVENYEGKPRLFNYHDDYGNFKSTTPTNEKDELVVKNAKDLLEKLNINKINVKLEIF